jgi:hypothetical protein
MVIDSSAPTSSSVQGGPNYEQELAREAQGEAPGSTAVHGIVGAAMVGLLGGGPRLAIRAARVVLEDSYGSPMSRGRLRGRVRHRGD